LEAINSALAISDESAVKKALREFRETVALKPYASVARLSQTQRMMAVPRPSVASLAIPGLIDSRPVQEMDESGFIDRTYSCYCVM
jgi:hypothetical protein